MFTPKEEEKVFFYELSKYKALCFKVRHTRSDHISARKRGKRDKLLYLFVIGCLASLFVAQIEYQK